MHPAGRILLVVLLCLAPGLARAASEQETTFSHDVEPKLLTSNSEPDVGAAFDLDLTHAVLTNAASAWRRDLQLRATGRGELTTQSGFSTQPLQLDLGLQVAQLLFKPARAGNDDPDSDVMAEPGFDWGQINLGLAFRLEKEQAGASDIALSTQLGYVLSEAGSLRWLVPSFLAGYDRVSRQSADVVAALGAPEDYDRWLLAASWATPELGVKGLRAHIDVRWAWEMSQPEAVQDAGLDSAQYLAVGLKYIFTEPAFGVLQGLHVMVSDGRVPPATVDETTLHLGFYVFR